MTAIPFAVSSAKGVKGQESGGRLINWYAEKAGEAAAFPVIWRGSAGLRQATDVIDFSHYRGGIVAGQIWIAVFDDRVFSVTEADGSYTATNIGELLGTTAVTCAKNNAATPAYVCVTENGAFNIFPSSAPTVFADLDLPQPLGVAELNGYFLFPIGDGRIFASGLNSVSVASNSYTQEQSLGGLIRGISFRGEFFAFGPNGAGVYRDVGATPFPLERQPYVIRRGLAGANAIAGWEPGWASELIWVGDDGIVYRLNGYTPEAVANEDVTRDVSAAIRAGLGSTLQAFVYMNDRHANWCLTNPGQWTHEYNLTTQNWNERKSYGRNDWRVSNSIRAFNRWMVGDQASGKLFEVDPTYYQEGADALVAELVSGLPATFPARGACLRADFDFTAGVGSLIGQSPTQIDPSVLVQWSIDGGASWKQPVPRKLGQQGKYNKKVSVQRVGQFGGHGIRFRLTISDPVHRGFAGGQMAIQQRAA